ncbi:jg23724 [Pararge aegeria aegeria]|uniref:unspecific monooxygenase n=1 Tax=Pararge aegeria aegeria TaxID=348720 RepID=A0A8S4R0P0_9NEOP|nr:jg23724 [Pararge aegeria aegeria]
MIVEIIVFLLTAILAYFLYLYKWVHHYFDKRGIKYLPGVPIFGNILNSTFLRNHLFDDLDRVYQAFPGERYVGYIEGTMPILIIRDPELIKSITIKDFDHFVDHKEFFSEEVEPLFGGSLIMMKGERWHDMRTTLSPAFTGSKMRKMLPFMTEISSNIVNHLKEWTQTELAGQVFIFFVAGYESSATALVMCVHELALNPDIQEKLYQEIIRFKEEHEQLTYENISTLKYLDGVLNETQRKWAAALIMDRVCNKPYVLPPPREGGKPVHLKPGDIVYNLVNSIQMDPQYHPNPTKFDPERFSDENKHNMKPFTYMPFGMGPRNCIASRPPIQLS